ncbi:uncharacterized protein LOC108819964 [Raphanus sativus]|uniref:Uncharacterized protein LOC108819964 n=1 Tax=Raphanus sativus TaxID=3726 RepID=A0A9W3CBH1_RAPSA|nr:uncharacterized protein LOC108819964 [Raphanus sativus]
MQVGYSARRLQTLVSWLLFITILNTIFSDQSLFILSHKQSQDRSSTFKILAELYCFKTCPNLLTVYNYEDEAVEEMIRISEKKGVKPKAAEFSWPSTEIVSEKLKRNITRSKRRRDKRGLFVFPLQSLVTGASYSYSWMSLGLSLFRPDFLICSFTEVLGQEDSPGFGCLFFKKSSSQALSEAPELITIINRISRS